MRDTDWKVWASLAVAVVAAAVELERLRRA
jgi:hypothetical protein